MAGELTVRTPGMEVISQQADSDAELVRLWLHGRGPRTLAAYRAESRALLGFAAKSIRAVALRDLHAYADTLAGLAPASRACRLGAVKFLLSFANRLGYVSFNVGAAIRLPAVRSARAERIMTPADVHRMLALEPAPRNAAMLHLLYGAGLRISELCGLAWRDLAPRDDAGQVTVFGKGGQTRRVLLPASVWRLLAALRGQAGSDAPVFASRSGGGHLDQASVHRVVKAAARRAGLPQRACPRTSCATPTPRMRSTGVLRSASCRPPSATPAWRPRAATCMPGRATAPRDTSGYRRRALCFLPLPASSPTSSATPRATHTSLTASPRSGSRCCAWGRGGESASRRGRPGRYTRAG